MREIIANTYIFYCGIIFMNMKQIKELVLAKIRPPKEEETKLNNFLRDLITTAKIISGLDVVVCGSTGKGDWLSGDHDIDLFIMFPKNTSREKLEDLGLLYGKQVAKDMHGEAHTEFAEHPYTCVKINEYDIDIVPCYRIKPGEKIKSAVDRSPLHLHYIINKFDDKLRDETRLLKQFMKGIGVYGSDVKTEGFSGYICELLISQYGSFESVLKAAAKWQAPQIIVLKGKPSKVRLVKKFDGKPLIFIDPVDKERNVAAVISVEKFFEFVKKSRDFINDPSPEYFFKQQPRVLSAEQERSLKERQTKFIAIVSEKPDIIDDIAYPQFRRAQKRLLSLLRENEFVVLRSYVAGLENEKKMAIIIELEVWSLPKIKKMPGPYVWSSRHVKEFLKKYSVPDFGPYIEGKAWVVDKKRSFPDVSHLLKDFLSQMPEELVKHGIPEQISSSMFKASFLEHDEFWSLVRSNQEFSDFLRIKYFERMN
ncbi:MAG: CCA tRNA nucleotidyltransferase [Candidatus Aenigmatarchaeota archaeon]